MDYQLNTLGTREFEHLSQALARRLVGVGLSVYGDGPDGGREASWRGDSANLIPEGSLNGYGVLQAKYKIHSTTVGENLKWLKREIDRELDSWAAPESRRKEIPDFLLFATNVRLSASPDSGKDAAITYLKKAIEDRKLPITESYLWDYDNLRVMLDDADDVRGRYLAFLTPGDVVSKLLNHLDVDSGRLAKALTISAARSLRDDSPLNLTQSGAMGETAATVADVFVDLPASWHPTETMPQDPHDNGSIVWAEITEDSDDLLAAESDEPTEAESDNDYPWSGPEQGICANLIDRLNCVSPDETPTGAHTRSFVLVGGPGQGKSTVTQWLAQIYRVSFLEGTDALNSNLDTARVAERVRERSATLSLPVIRARRWPFRVTLTDLADYLAASSDQTLVQYLAHRLTQQGSVQIAPQSVIDWIRTYPTLLLIDGLDEVPGSSNRADVLLAIRDFVLEVDSEGADVAIVITTRPQGYATELANFGHIQLNKLDMEVAMKCADALISVRFGADSNRGSVVLDRLRKASVENSTRRLFESPLQVTILAVLLEKIGKAPGDRYRLFAAYYEVISSREQEKSGDLSDILQKHESDIITVHRQIGARLQQRAGEAGETSSTLSLSEFDEVITNHFLGQGHTADETDALRASFAVLVTDRLVFLTFVSGDRIGFELRSLQEFMAGEYIVSLKEARVMENLKRVALSSYWRNVVLFAIGSIFARNEHLRAEVVLLCKELNELPGYEWRLAGSELALEVLLDGSPLTMPRYTEHLAEIAARLLDYEQSALAMRLANLREPRLQSRVLSHARQLAGISATGWLNRATYYTAPGPKSHDTKIELQNLIDAAPDPIKRHLARFIWSARGNRFDSVFESLMNNVTPADLEGDAFSHRNSRTVSNATQAIRELFRYPAGWMHEGSKEPIAAVWYPLLSNAEEWSQVAESEAVVSAWPAVAAVAEFALDPDRDSLARAITQIAHAGDPNIALHRAPWVLKLCLLQVRYQADVATDWDPVRFASAGEAVAREVTEGKWGDRSDWLAAEDRSTSNGPLTPDAVGRYLASLDVAHVPMEVPPSGGIVRTTFTYEDGPAQIYSVLDTIVLHRYGTTLTVAEADTRELANFLLSVWTSSPRERRDSSGGEEQIRRYASWMASSLHTPPLPNRLWWGWIGTQAEDESLVTTASELKLIGSIRELVSPALIDSPEELADRLLKIAGSDPELWPVIRLAFLLNPSLLANVPESYWGEIESVPGTPVKGRFIRVVRTALSWMRDGAPDTNLDWLISERASHPRDPMGLVWLTRFLTEIAMKTEPFRLVEIARGISNLEPQHDLSEIWDTIQIRTVPATAELDKPEAAPSTRRTS